MIIQQTNEWTWNCKSCVEQSKYWLSEVTSLIVVGQGLVYFGNSFTTSIRDWTGVKLRNDAVLWIFVCFLCFTKYFSAGQEMNVSDAIIEIVLTLIVRGARVRDSTILYYNKIWFTSADITIDKCNQCCCSRRIQPSPPCPAPRSTPDSSPPD